MLMIFLDFDVHMDPGQQPLSTDFTFEIDGAPYVPPGDSVLWMSQTEIRILSAGSSLPKPTTVSVTWPTASIDLRTLVDQLWVDPFGPITATVP